MVNDLEHYLATTYTKRQLAKLLADAVTMGELPVLPTDDTISQQNAAPRGRPTKGMTGEYIAQLKAVLASNYPTRIDVKALSYLVNLSVKTLQRWARRVDILAELPIEHREYFYQITQRYSLTRLNTAERAVLDVHNYLWTAVLPGARLPLHSWHAPVWGLRRGNSSPEHNSYERNRLRSDTFLTVLQEAGLPAPVYTLPEGPYSVEPKACSIIPAIVRKRLPTRLNALWTLLLSTTDVPGEYIPLNANDNTIYDPQTYDEAIRILMGVR